MFATDCVNIKQKDQQHCLRFVLIVEL